MAIKDNWPLYLVLVVQLATFGATTYFLYVYPRYEWRNGRLVPRPAPVQTVARRPELMLFCKEFAYTTDAQLQSDIEAWFTTLRQAKTPPRDFRMNFVTTSRILITATYGISPVFSAGPGAANAAPPDPTPQTDAMTP
jgi:hypothetical protein